MTAAANNAANPSQSSSAAGIRCTDIVSRSFEDGYNVGLNWTHDWHPGGPWVYRGRNTTMADESTHQHKQWHAGFQAGRQAANVKGEPR